MLSNFSTPELILFIFSMIVVGLALISMISRKTQKGPIDPTLPTPTAEKGSDYLESAKAKLRGQPETKRSWLEELFRTPADERRDYYRNEYLKSDAWQRKRFVVLRRDQWICKYCGGRATEVHHLRYAKRNIGKEPIDWLVSTCRPCHQNQHS